MRCEPWMDRTPTPRKTPRQLAQAELDRWLDRIRSLNDDLYEAERQCQDARERLEKLEKA